MSKTSVLSRPKVSENHQRNGFDRGRSISFNMSAGMILPLWWNYYTAGSRVKLNRAAILRAANVNTAAFQDVSFYMDFYKVPLRYLWSPWNDWKLNINDVNSSSVLGVDANGLPDMPVRCPNFDINQYESIIRSDFESSSPANFPKDSLGFAYINGYFRLKDCFRYGSYDLAATWNGEGDAPYQSFRVNPFPALAYQKIYYDHYRNTAYESNQPLAYNVDWVGSNTDLDPTDITNPRTARLFKEMFTLRYVNLHRDFYRNIYPALNYVSSSPNGATWSIPDSVSGQGQSSIFAGARNLSSFPTYSPSLVNSNNQAAVISVQSIRALFALDKLMRASAYAPKHVKDQFKARFGVTMPDAVSFESERIGSYKTNIDFQEVVSTAETQTTSGSDTTTTRLGTIGGKGIGVSALQKPLSTYCEEDCIIMAMCYVLPKVQYDNFGCDNWLTKLNRESFYQEEFENLGLEPVYAHEVVRMVSSVSQYVTFNNRVLGYRPRNSVYKISPDLNLGLFKRRNYTGRQYGSSNMNVSFSTGSLTPFVTHANLDPVSADVYETPGVNLTYFKCNPKILDSIFEQSYDSAGDQDTDQFFGMMEIPDGTIANISVHGMPSL